MQRAWRWTALPTFSPDSDGGAAGAGSDTGGQSGAAAGGGKDGGAAAGATSGGAAGGDKGSPPAGDAAGAAGKSAGGAGEGAGAAAAPKIPDKFLVDGKLDPNKLLTSYTELERAQFRRREEVRAEARKEIETEILKNRPATPGDYAPTAKFKVGEREVELNDADPMLNWLKETAYKYNVPAGEIDGIVQGYVSQMIAAAPPWTAEAEQLGANADARHARVDGWMKGNLSPENYGVFAAMPATARLIKALEEVMTVAGSPPVSADSANLPGEVFTRDELKTMMRDPRYSGIGGKIDNAYVAKVRAGFQRLNNGRA